MSITLNIIANLIIHNKGKEKGRESTRPSRPRDFPTNQKTMNYGFKTFSIFTTTFFNGLS